MLHNQADEEYVDELGPGSDLVLSLLAMCLLLLAVLGIGFTQETGKIALLTEKLVQVEARPKVPEIAGGRVIEIRDSSDVPLFARGENKLTDIGGEVLWKKGYELGLQIGQSDANLLVIEGHASPEIFARQGRNINKVDDGNLDLSAARATEVAHYFHYLGIPYDCVEVRGYGSSRSKLTAEQHARLVNRQGVSDLEDALSADRRIKITGVRDDQSSCGVLSKYFQRWPKSAPSLPSLPAARQTR